MGAYILRRLLLVIPTLVGIMIINFALTQFVPGGPIEQILAQLEGGGDVFEGISGGGSELVATTTPRNSLNYDEFHTLDVRASRIFELPNSELTAFIEISNVYNRENACCTEYSMSVNGAGESVLVTEPEQWLPLVPSIGVLWKF